MEVDAGDGAMSQGKMLPAEGLKALVVLHVPHSNILGVGNWQGGQEWVLRDVACLRPGGAPGGTATVLSHCHRPQAYDRDTVHVCLVAQLCLTL